MISKIKILLMAGALFTVPLFVIAVTEVTSCQEITAPGDYVLNKDLTSVDKTCLKIHDVAQVNLNCNGHYIYRDAVSGSYYNEPVVSIENVKDFTVDSCKIETKSANIDWPFYDLNIKNSQNGVFENNNFGSRIFNAEKISGFRFTANYFKSNYQQYHSQNNILENNTFDPIPRFNGGAGNIVSQGGSDNIFRGNIIDGKSDGVLRWVNPLGLDDGIVLEDESNDLVENNITKNFFDCGIETAGFIQNTKIIGNFIKNAGFCGIGGWYHHSWKGNEVSRNTMEDIPTAFQFFRAYGIKNTESKIYFRDNIFEGNVFINPKEKFGHSSVINLGHAQTDPGNLSYVGRVNGTERLTVPADFDLGGNVFKNNNFGTVGFAPMLIPSTIAVDGGGNVCGQAVSADSLPYPINCAKTAVPVAPVATKPIVEPMSVESVPASSVDQLQTQLQTLQNQLVTLQNQQTTSEQTATQTQPPSLSFNALFLQAIVNTEVYTLSWGSVGADSCKADWKNANVPLTGFENVGVPNDQKVKFTLTCIGSGGSVSKSVGVGGAGKTSVPPISAPTPTTIQTVQTPVTTQVSQATTTPPAPIPTSPVIPVVLSPVATSISSVVPSVSITTPSVSSKPDLTIYEFSLNPKAETYYKSQPFSLSYILKNIGAKESGQFKLSLLNKTNGADLGGGAFNGLAPGGVWNQTSSWSGLYWASEGYNLIELKVDGGNMVDESNENNNLTTFGILVLAGPPPTATATTTSTSSVASAQSSGSSQPTSVSSSQTSATSSTGSTTSTTSSSSSSNTATSPASTSTSSSSSSSLSSGSATIQVSPKFTVSTPTNLVAGQSHTITWQMMQGNSTSVRISLYQNGGFKDFVTTDTVNDGSHAWTPSVSLSGSGYSFRVFDFSYPNDYADSGQFSIVSDSASASNLSALASILESAQGLIKSLTQEINNLRK